MDKNKLIKVTNRKNGTVGYIIPEMGNLQRQFAPGVSKEIPFEELQNLCWIKGGRVILKNYLIIEDPEAVKALQMTVEPEYYYSDKDIIEIMTKGTLDQFLDMLDFSNMGVKESIKQLAVDLPLNDVAKRQAILEKLSFNVDNAIMVKNAKFDNGEEDTTNQKRKSGRRAAVPNTPTTEKKEDTPTRRYKVVEE